VNFHIVILSATPGNLIACLKQIFLRETAATMNLKNVIVIDDGVGPETRKLFPGIQWIDAPKPFIFSRNVNLAARTAGTDIALVGDDVILQTHDGLSAMSKAVRIREDVGICTPAVVGMAHLHQAPQGGKTFRATAKNLAFVSVYIKKSTFDTVGPMDERFVGYGYDDDDYCVRVRNAGLQVGVYEGCIVTHRVEMSAFRKIPNEKFMQMYRDNEKLYKEKWKI